MVIGRTIPIILKMLVEAVVEAPVEPTVQLETMVAVPIGNKVGIEWS